MFLNGSSSGGGGCNSSRAMKPPGGESHDLFGAEFKGTPCHNRVLKPPGGGTSDIFGAPEPPAPNTPRRARNNLQSSVFGPPANGEITPRTKSGNDSHNRLFGPADSRPQSASKNRLKSNIILSNDESASPTKDKNSNSPPKDFSTSTVDGLSTKDGNPVTGEGYVNEEKPQSAVNNVAAAAPAAPTTNGTSSHSAPPQRARVPPGGFSSGLW